MLPLRHRFPAGGLAAVLLTFAFSAPPARAETASVAPAAPAVDATLPALEQARAESYARVAPAVAAVACLAGERNTRFYGSGVCISADGLILTSSSVVPDGAREVRVRFAGEQAFAAQVVARADEAEAVLLKLDPAPPMPRRFLAARALEPAVGERVYTAGNPHHTLSRDGAVYFSAGTLSGRYTARSEDPRSRYRGPVLETDAAVNPGCDGGPLVDAQGRLLGLVSLCYGRARRLGTAVPLARILSTLPQAREALKAGGEDAHAPHGDGVLPDDGTIGTALREASTAVRTAVVRIYFNAGDERQTSSDRGARRPSFVDGRRSKPDETARAAEPAPGCVTGVLVDARGWVLTSALLVPANEKRATVALADGRRLRCRVRGRDLGLDVALLEIEDRPARLPVAALANESVPPAGSFVCVLGAPQDGDRAEATFTAGIVSASDRMDGQAVQIDARVNAGSAGGAVVGLDGRLLGIVSHESAHQPWGRNTGVGFFAPGARILERLARLQDGEVIRPQPQPFLGVRPVIGLPANAGLVLAEVVENAPAWKAGLRAGDVVLRLGGQAIASWPELVVELKKHRPGDALEVRYRRGAEADEAETKVKLEERP